MVRVGRDRAGGIRPDHVGFENVSATTLTWRRGFLVLLVVVVGTIVACGSGTNDGADDAQSPYPIRPTDGLVSTGQPLYAQNCASCHGDADIPPLLASAPPHTDSGHTWHHADRLLVEWILDGVPLATTMPEWRGQLTEKEVIAIVAYIKTFWSADNLDQQIRGSVQYEAQVREFGN